MENTNNENMPIEPVKSKTGLIFDDKKLSYKATVQENPKDRIEVIIGDDKDLAKFQPQLKICRWDNEVNSSVRLILPETDETISQGIDEKITIARDDLEVKMYERDDLREGGFEFEIILKEKPATNKFEFSVNTKELDWFYQPELTKEEIDEGVERPENVVGSYAVYHKTKGGMNEASGMEYKTGKVFHKYRSEAVDARGNRIWLDSHLDTEAGTLTETIDQNWLDNAVYPVVVDPTFGYTTLGSSDYTYIADDGYATAGKVEQRTGESFTTSGAGDITKITVALDDGYSDCGNVNVKGFVNETDSGGAGSHGQVGTGTITNTNLGNDPGWFDITISCSITASNDYLLNVVGDSDAGLGGAGAIYIAGDYIGSGQNPQYSENKLQYDSPESPWTATGSGNAWKLSIYATYTAGASSAIKTINGLAKASVKTVNGLAIASVKTWNGLA